MWTLGQKAAKYNRLPSSFFPWLVDPWTCYCFDNAILYFCTVIENASLETRETGFGDSKKTVAKYTMVQLLDPDFRLPRPQKRRSEDGLGTLIGLAGVPGARVKTYRYVGPGAELPPDKG